MAAVLTKHKPMFVGMAFDAVPDDDRRVVHAALTGADKLDGGVLQELTGDENYSSNGMSNGGTEWLKWTPSATQIAALNTSALIHFEIESDFLEPTITVENRIFTAAGGGEKIMRGPPDNTYQQLDNAPATSLHTNRLSKIDRSWTTHTMFDTLVQGNKIKTYIDNVLILDTVISIWPSFETLNLFASQTGTTIWGTDAGCSQRIKNFYVVSGSIAESHHTQLSNVHLYGDSLTRTGQLQVAFPDLIGDPGSNWQDQGYAAKVISEIRSKGIFPRVHGHGVSGDTLADLQTDINATAHLAGAAVVVYIGINDIRGAGSALVTGWEAAYQALIPSIRALGADHVFVCNMVSTAEDTVDPEATSRPAADEANAVIAATAASLSYATLIDLYTAFGGRNYNLDNYQADSLHYNETGSRLVGEVVAASILRHYGY